LSTKEISGYLPTIPRPFKSVGQNIIGSNLCASISLFVINLFSRLPGKNGQFLFIVSFRNWSDIYR